MEVFCEGSVEKVKGITFDHHKGRPKSILKDEMFG